MTLIPQHFQAGSKTLAADHPYQDKARDRRSDADHAQNVVRRRLRALHGPAHPGRACREQKPFKHKQNTHTDEEVGERYGPHRTATSRLMLFLLFFGKRPRSVTRVAAFGLLLLRRGGRGSSPARRTAEEPEEIGVGPQQEAG